MKTRLIICALWGIAVLVLAYFVDAHILIAGGGPCLIIINEGGRAYGAIEAYEASGMSGTVASTLQILKAAVSASCSLTSYGSLYKQGEGGDLEGEVLDKIGDFHQDLIAHLGEPTYDVGQHAQKLEKLNRKLCNLIEPNTYPNP